MYYYLFLCQKHLLFLTHCPVYIVTLLQTGSRRDRPPNPCHAVLVNKSDNQMSVACSFCPSK